MLIAPCRKAATHLATYLVLVDAMRRADYGPAVSEMRRQSMGALVEIASILHRTPRDRMGDTLFRHLKRVVPSFEHGCLDARDVANLREDLILAALEWERHDLPPTTHHTEETRP